LFTDPVHIFDETGHLMNRSVFHYLVNNLFQATPEPRIPSNYSKTVLKDMLYPDSFSYALILTKNHLLLPGNTVRNLPYNK